MPAFSGFGHLAFKVNDLKTSLDFYEKLGFPEFLRLTEADGEPWIAYLKISDELYLELFPGGDGSKVPGPEHTGAGVNHLCLTTTDIEATVAELAAKGIHPMAPFDPSKRGADRNRGLFIADPDGNRIEVMEMAPNCIQYEAIRDVNAGKAPHALVRPR